MEDGSVMVQWNGMRGTRSRASSFDGTVETDVRRGHFCTNTRIHFDGVDRFT